MDANSPLTSSSLPSSASTREIDRWIEREREREREREERHRERKREKEVRGVESKNK